LPNTFATPRTSTATLSSIASRSSSFAFTLFSVGVRSSLFSFGDRSIHPMDGSFPK
jgi:hypothetical protein